MSSRNGQKTTFTYTISGEPLSIHVGGTENELFHEIEFVSPSSKQLTEVVELKQYFSRAMLEGSKIAQGRESAEGAKTAADIDGDDLMAAITLSHEPLKDVLTVGSKLLTSGVGKFGGKPFTKTMLERLDADEIISMIGAYVRNFIVASLLNN